MMVLPLLTGKTIFTTKDTTLAPHASAGEHHEGKTKKNHQPARGIASPKSGSQ
jgi:hypothetical protein